MLVTNFHLKRFLYTVMCGFRQLRDVAEIHPARALALRALERTADFIERDMPDALGMEKQADVLRYALSQVTLDGAFLEFGVFNGGTARFIAKLLGQRQLHGFDSFEGLPEAWTGFDLGSRAFSRQGRLPRVPSNVTLHKGWFNDTIPKWKADHPGRLAFVHIDCDIYSSTKSILDLLADRIEPGTVIVFDEYFNFPNWEAHEHKAFYEYLAANRVAYEPLAYARQQLAVKIKTISATDT
jgi:predicted O-methyltransferase YrrM